MKNGKRFLAIGLTAAMAAGLAACGSTGSTGTDTASSAVSSTEAAAETSTSAASESAASSDSAASNGDIVTLTWYAVGTGMPSNYDSWAEKVNAYLADKIGVNIDMQIIPWGDWESRRSVIVTTASDYDILFTNGNTYTQDVNTGAFLDITDLLDENCPELMKLIPESYWDACRVNGQIYAIPTYKDSSQSEYIVWDQDEVDKLGEDVSGIHELDDMTPVLQKELDATGETPFPMYSSASAWMSFDYDNFSSGLPAIGVRHDDEKAQVVAVFEQDDVQKRLSTIRGWYEAGIVNSDAATKPEENAVYRFCNIAQGWSGAAKTSWGPSMGVNCSAYQWGPTVVSNDTVRGSLNCISANCEHPEKALQFLDLLNSDTWLRDMFYYGEEGVDWEYTDDKLVHRIKTDWTMAGYTQATFFTVSQTDDVDFNQWDEVKKLNENAEPSVLLGFTFDTTNVNDELTNCISIYNNYKSELLTGTVDPKEGAAQMMSEMRDAGFDDIQAEAQKQIDAFLASKQ